MSNDKNLTALYEIGDALGLSANNDPPHVYVPREVRKRLGSHDWTVDPATGRSNSSDLYLRIVADVAKVIGDARVGDSPETHARLVVSHLAHIYGLRPWNGGR